MAAKETTIGQSKVNTREIYELKFEAEKLGVSTQVLVGAKLATGSTDRNVIGKYLKERNLSGNLITKLIRVYKGLIS